MFLTTTITVFFVIRATLLLYQYYIVSREEFIEFFVYHDSILPSFGFRLTRFLQQRLELNFRRLPRRKFASVLLHYYSGASFPPPPSRRLSSRVRTHVHVPSSGYYTSSRSPSSLFRHNSVISTARSTVSLDRSQWMVVAGYRSLERSRAYRSRNEERERTVAVVPLTLPYPSSFNERVVPSEIHAYDGKLILRKKKMHRRTTEKKGTRRRFEDCIRFTNAIRIDVYAVPTARRYSRKRR